MPNIRVDYKGLGRRIRAERRARHLTQKELAKITGLTPQFLGMLELGKRVPSVQTLTSLCYALNTPVELLLQDTLPENLFHDIPEAGTHFTLCQVMSTLRNTLSDALLSCDAKGAAPAVPGHHPPIPFAALDEEIDPPSLP